jgi:hypothetical protein
VGLLTMSHLNVGWMDELDNLIIDFINLIEGGDLNKVLLTYKQTDETGTTY